MEFWTGAIGITKMRMIPSALANGYDLFAQDAASAEEMGFDAYGAPEHHFTYDAFLPFPLGALAAAAFLHPDAEACEVMQVVAHGDRRQILIAEGAGALATAVAVSGRAGGGRIVCIVSGGNIDAVKLATILEGGTPAH